MPLVIRPVLVVLALGALVVALAQVSGRILVAGLDDLEPAVNSYLGDRGLRLTGLQGGWAGLNPVLRAERVEFPGGFVRELVLELDWLETLARSHLVLRHGSVEEGFLSLHRDEEGRWGLPGGSAGEAPDVTRLLWHSDQLRFAGQLVFSHAGGRSQPITVRYQAVNRAGRHRVRLELANGGDDCVEECRLSGEFESREGFWRLQPRSRQLSVEAAGLRLPAELLGPSALRIAAADLHWAQGGGRSSGQGRLAVDGFRLSDAEPLALSLQAASSGAADAGQALVLRELVWQLGDERWTAQDWHGRYGDDVLELWTPELDVERVAGLLRQVLAGVPAASRWLGNLRPGGQARNVRFYLRPGTGEIGYAATLAEARIDSYKGVPRVRGGAGELVGYGRGMRFDVNSSDTELGFLETFPESWAVDYGQGVVDLWFDGDYVGLRGRNLRADAGATRAAGGFAVANPDGERDRQQLTLLLAADAMNWQAARAFIPAKLPDGLPEWLEQGPQQAELSDLRLAYRGALHSEPGAADRRVELSARVRRGTVRFDPAWPPVEEADGALAVSGDEVRVRIDRGRCAGAELRDSRLLLGDNAAYALLELDAEQQADDVLDFLRGSPLSQWLSFVEPDWQGAGPLRVSGSLRVPLRSDSALAEAQGSAGADPAAERKGLEVDLGFDFQAVALELPGYRLRLEDLRGRLDYRYPYGLAGDGLQARVFGEPVSLTAGNDGEAVLFTATGRAAPADVYALADLADPGMFDGAAAYEARIRVPVTDADVPRVSVRSDLQGVAAALPAGLGKAAAERRETEARLAFYDDYLALSFDYGSTRGWLHLDDGLQRGAVGFDQPVPLQSVAQSDLLLTGSLPAVALDELLPAGDGAGGALPLPVPVRLDALAFAELRLGDFPVPEPVVSGTLDGSGIDLRVDSSVVAGAVRLPADGVLALDLERVSLPAGEEGSGDPLDPALIADLPAADVRVASFTVGEDDYGRWSFELRPEPGGVRLGALEAQVRGAVIEAEQGVFWRRDDNRSRFDGVIRTGDLAEVLPQWGFAPSITSESSSLEGHVAWAGSPANVDLERLEGSIYFRADQGHFLDVEGGPNALRMVSLLNFSTVLKRMRFDFSDVTGRGLSYQKIRAPLAFDRGMLRLPEPVQIDGSGSSFRINGTLNLVDGTLDNEMIVTLPVSKSLPWYAAYVALANPLAGLGVLVGQQVLRKPLEQFSSAKYEISGTVDNPEVKFINVWDTSMKDGQVAASSDAAAADGAAPQAASQNPAEAAPDGAGDPPAGAAGPPASPQPDNASEGAEPEDSDET